MEVNMLRMAAPYGGVRRLATLVLAVTMLGGCASQQADRMPQPPTVQVAWTDRPIVIDGKLDDPVWQRAPGYALLPALDVAGQPGMRDVPTRAQLAWDHEYLYVAAQCTDDDLHMTSDKDQQHHYLMGDLFELFLKPEDSTWYWELYGTPRNNRTAFWHPGAGLIVLYSSELDPSGIRVGAQCRGTLNDWTDRDSGWTVEMAVPLSMLAARGDRFDPQTPWRVLLARYDFSRYHVVAGPLRAMYPQLPRTYFHDLPNFAVMKLQEPTAPPHDHE